jgi:cob(I)alamin adenosyltransferase
MKIYTKKGDSGETSLVYGTRVSKGDDLIELYGKVDYLNSLVGLSASFLTSQNFKDVIENLQNIQSFLFSWGSLLASEDDKKAELNVDKDFVGQVEKLEKLIDQYTQELPELKSFILPGGHQGASSLHLCRTYSREIERYFVRYLNHNKITNRGDELKYINRLSDYFFTLSRIVNYRENISTPPWP